MKSFAPKHFLFIAVSAIVLLAGTWYLTASFSRRPQLAVLTVGTATVTQGVSTTGVVQAEQDIALAFQQSGTVAKLDVAAGDQVKKGDVLAELDTKTASAGLSQAQGQLKAAQANYQKIVNGATSADIDVAQAAVTSAQTALDNANKNLDVTTKQQDLLVSNAYASLLNTVSPSLLSNGLTAVPSSSNTDNVTVTISGTYSGTAEGVYNLSIYSTGEGMKFQTSGLESVSGYAKTQPVALGRSGLSIQFSAQPSIADSWTINIPNTQSPSYIVDYNAYNAALATQNSAVQSAQNQVSTAQAALDQAQAALALKQTSARPEDVDAAQAQVLTAQAQVQNAQSVYSNATITAPVDGTITSVDAKIGEVASPGRSVISMISSGRFQTVVYLAESELSRAKPGDTAQVRLDAYGDAVSFPATVAAIDPASTNSGNLQGYKATLEFTQDDNTIKDGMGANVDIFDQASNDAVSIPLQDVFSDGQNSFVLLQTGGGIFVHQPVTTGLTGLDGKVEITSGLKTGDRIADFTNNHN